MNSQEFFRLMSFNSPHPLMDFVPFYERIHALVTWGIIHNDPELIEYVIKNSNHSINLVTFLMRFIDDLHFINDFTSRTIYLEQMKNYPMVSNPFIKSAKM